MWPSYNEYKHGLETWLRSNHPKYLDEVGETSWTNSFAGNHHTMVIIVNYPNMI
jgi:hypothetical protein